MTYPADMAATKDGGRIRTLTPPWTGQPHTEAAREVLTAWCRANGLDPAVMLDRDNIEIHEAPPAAGAPYVIFYREVVPRTPGARHEARTVLRKVPLLVEPRGLLAGELTCGHVHSLGDPATAEVCGEHIDPATGRHPDHHRTEDGSAGWPNHHPGDQAYRAGLPYAGDMEPDAAHALVLARLQEVADRRPRVDRSRSLIAITPLVRGLRELAERHGPRAIRTGHTVCDHDYVSATGLTPWPCPDYRAAVAGIVTFPNVAL